MSFHSPSKDPDLTAFRQSAKSDYAVNRRFLQQLKRSKPKDLDEKFHRQHDEVFSSTDCLACANCCKTTSPIFYHADIQRMAPSLKMKVPEFIETYLKVDEDGDYVLKTAPCPFLAPDNTCIVYQDRPRACREYPHTNRKRMHQILKLTLKNTLVCPATLKIVNQLRSQKET